MGQVHYPDHNHKPNPNPLTLTLNIIIIIMRSVLYKALVRIMHLTRHHIHLIIYVSIM